MKKIIFIVNGQKINPNSIRTKIDSIFAKEFAYEIWPTTYATHAIELATKAVQNGCHFLIAVGGDGTMSEVIHGHMQAEPQERARTAIGLLPQGNGNDFARTLGIKNSLTDLRKFILENRTRHIDLGEITFINHNNEPGRRFFNNIVDVGLSACVVKYINSHKRMAGVFGYFNAIIQSFFTFKHQKVKITTDTTSWDSEITSVCIANGKYFGKGLGIAPNANAFNGTFELVVIEKIRMFTFLRYFFTLKRAEPICNPKIKYHTTKACNIDSFGHKYPIDLDGEFIGTTPMAVKIIPGAINFLGNF